MCGFISETKYLDVWCLRFRFLVELSLDSDVRFLNMMFSVGIRDSTVELDLDIWFRDFTIKYYNVV